MDDHELRRFFYNRLHPETALEPGDDRWVDLSAATEDLLEPMKTRVLLEDAYTCQLLTGFIGTGKSTALMRLSQQLRGEGFEVVYSQAEPLFGGDYSPTDLGDVLTYIGYALYEADLGRGFLAELLDEAKSVLQGEIRTEVEAAIQAGPAQLKLELRRNPVLGDRVRALGRQRSGSLTRQLEGWIESAQARVKRSKRRGLVLVIDVLDRVVGLPTNAAEVEDSVRHVLLERSELRKVPTHLVLSVPPSMIRYEAALEAVYTGQLMVLPAVRTRQKDLGPEEQGIRLLVEFLARRAGGQDHLDQVFGDSTALARLIAASGGALRVVMQLARSCLSENTEFPISKDVVDGVIVRASRAYNEALLDDYKPHLTHMMESPDQRFPRTEATLPLLQSLFRSLLLLRYHNADYWEALHPLALRHFDSARFEQLLARAEDVARADR